MNELYGYGNHISVSSLKKKKRRNLRKGLLTKARLRNTTEDQIIITAIIFEDSH